MIKRTIRKVGLLYNTLCYLKPIQWVFRGRQFLQGLFPLKLQEIDSTKIKSQRLEWKDSISFPPLFFQQNNKFLFLNLEHEFKSEIDWNWLDYGRLWAYNLNYFEFLDQEDITVEEGLFLIRDYISQIEFCKVGLEPYPLSLRCFNWIRFFIKYDIKGVQYDVVLYQQLLLLKDELEYHLLGNHLLENAFSLLFGAYYFNDSKLYQIANRILLREFDEQILTDGAHFERSPMYHCTMLFRILDCYNMIQSNPLFNGELLCVIREKSIAMLGWLKSILFDDGTMPLFNDAAFKIAPSPELLFDYANRLGLTITPSSLSDSGYRKLQSNKFEAIIDVANIGPDYQPGHAHADTFTFELHVNNRPVIVDTGTSSYEVNDSRFYERSTAAHNTVVVDDTDSSQVWAGHRVAKRAYVALLQDTRMKVIATHDGYKSKRILHKRSFEIKEGNYIVTDNVDSKAVAYLHFHPSEKIEIKEDVIIGSDYKILFNGACSIEKLDSVYAPEFNKRRVSTCLRIKFDRKLQTIFK